MALLEEEGKFEEILSLRAFEQASPELGSRIISQADPGVSGTVKTGLYEYPSGFFSFFNFQIPAFALAIILVLGITLGYLYDNYNDINANAIELNDFLYYEGEFYD